MQEVIKPVSADGSHAPLDHEGSYDHRCDVYSFGVLLWEVMHVQIPFGHLGAVEAAVSAHSGVRPTIDLRGERLRFAPIIEACWSHEPDHRPALAEVARKFLQLENAGLGLGMAAVAAPGGMMPGMMPAAMPMAMAGGMSGVMPGQFAPQCDDGRHDGGRARLSAVLWGRRITERITQAWRRNGQRQREPEWTTKLGSDLQPFVAAPASQAPLRARITRRLRD